MGKSSIFGYFPGNNFFIPLPGRDRKGKVLQIRCIFSAIGVHSFLFLEKVKKFTNL